MINSKKNLKMDIGKKLSKSISNMNIESSQQQASEVNISYFNLLKYHKGSIIKKYTRIFL